MWHCDSRYWHIDIDHSQKVLLIGNVHTERNYSTGTIQQQALLVAVAAASYVEYSTDNPFIFFKLAVSLIRRPMMPNLQVCSEINLKLKLASQVTINDNHSTIPEILPFYHPSVAFLNPITKNHNIQFHPISLKVKIFKKQKQDRIIQIAYDIQATLLCCKEYMW